MCHVGCVMVIKKPPGSCREVQQWAHGPWQDRWGSSKGHPGPALIWGLSIAPSGPCSGFPGAQRGGGLGEPAFVFLFYKTWYTDIRNTVMVLRILILALWMYFSGQVPERLSRTFNGASLEAALVSHCQGAFCLPAFLSSQTLLIDALHGFVYQVLNLYLADMFGEDFLLLL